MEANKHDHQRTAVPDQAMVTDPVCGMRVQVDAPLKLAHGGRPIASAATAAWSASRPTRHSISNRRPPTLRPPDPPTTAPQRPIAAATPGKRMTHRTRRLPPTRALPSSQGPDVREPAPGACPFCGVALESKMTVPPTIRTEYSYRMQPKIVQRGAMHR
jgi:hypothetical protein